MITMIERQTDRQDRQAGGKREGGNISLDPARLGTGLRIRCSGSLPNDPIRDPADHGGRGSRRACVPKGLRLVKPRCLTPTLQG